MEEKNFSLRKIDLVIILVVMVIVIVGVLAVFGIKKQSKNNVVDNKRIQFQVYLRNIPYTGEHALFNKGEKTFITIRNVPYKEVKIVNVDADMKKIIVSNDKAPEGFMVLPDPSMPGHYDFIVTLEEKAQITKDGPVVAGNKIKTGVQMVLEGSTYRLNGIVSDVKILNDVDDLEEIEIKDSEE